ncbi:MAG: hypothetical protein IT378_12665 [Sandaracinaceae bacterium]|nr:hypothetical protein [Sandaracinaceae bacterium]
MADILTLFPDDGLETLRSHLVYTKVRLAQREATRPFVAAHDELLGRWSALHAGQLAAWDAEDEADARVAAADDELDDRTNELHADLLRTFGKEHPTYQRYMGGDSRSALVRMGLATQLDRIEGWPASLRSLGGALPAHADPLQQLVTDGRAALAARVAAASARADHRVGAYLAYVEDVNAVRRSTYGALVQYAADHQLPSDWARRFFRKQRRRPKPRPE